MESSQYVSSLLIGAPYAAGDIEIALTGKTVSQPYIDMTVDVMGRFGAEVITREKKLFNVRSRRHYRDRGTSLKEMHPAPPIFSWLPHYAADGSRS